MLKEIGFPCGLLIIMQAIINNIVERIAKNINNPPPFIFGYIEN